MQNAFKTMAGAFLLAALLVYMVMASQFESFRHPLVIMFTIPLSLTGVVMALLITGRPINLPVLIGIVLLGGMIATTFLTLFVIPIIYSLFEKVSFNKQQAIE